MFNDMRILGILENLNAKHIQSLPRENQIKLAYYLHIMAIRELTSEEFDDFLEHLVR